MYESWVLAAHQSYVSVHMYEFRCRALRQLELVFLAGQSYIHCIRMFEWMSLPAQYMQKQTLCFVLHDSEAHTNIIYQTHKHIYNMGSESNAQLGYLRHL